MQGICIRTCSAHGCCLEKLRTCGEVRCFRHVQPWRFPRRGFWMLKCHSQVLISSRTWIIIQINNWFDMKVVKPTLVEVWLINSRVFKFFDWNRLSTLTLHTSPLMCTSAFYWKIRAINYLTAVFRLWKSHLVGWIEPFGRLRMAPGHMFDTYCLFHSLFLNNKVTNGVSLLSLPSKGDIKSKSSLVLTSAVSGFLSFTHVKIEFYQ